MQLRRCGDKNQCDQNRRPGFSLRLTIQERKLTGTLAEGVKTLDQTATPAREHRRVAQGEAAGFGFTQLLKHVEEIGWFVGLEDDHKLLIVKTERIRRVQFY